MGISQTETGDIDFPFDEEWYLRQHGDIAEAVRTGGLRSGAQHYLLHGRTEGRLPVPPAEALSRWETLRSRFPADSGVYMMRVRAFRMSGQHDQADAALSDAIQRFPADPAPAIEAARTAAARGAWQDAQYLWSGLLKRFPDRLDCHFGVAHALREVGRVDDADAMLRAVRDRFPDNPNAVWELAWLSSWRRDWPEAIRRWGEARELFPDRMDAFMLPVRALCELRRYREAEQLLTEAITRFPGTAEPALEFARVARHQDRLEDAVARYARVTAEFPGNAAGWLECARVYHDMSRMVEAEERLLAGARHCPDNPWIQLELARLPASWRHGRQRDLPEALRRLERFRGRFPSLEAGYITGVHFLLEGLLFDEAEQLAKDGCERLPLCRDIAILYGRAAERRADWPEAIGRFTSARQRFADDPECDAALARALALAGRPAEADELTSDLMARFPGLAASFAAHAEVASVRQDWPEALLRWTDAARRFPGEPRFAKRAYEANLRVAEMAVQRDIVVVPASRPDPATIQDSVRDLTMQFASLGGSAAGCEFGIFQRRCGAEPIDLLRWADMPFDMLLLALDSDFEGVGDEGNTELTLAPVPGGRREYSTRDRRGMMDMHSFVHEDEVPFDKMHAGSCRRLRYLAGKLIDDLNLGDKIFVYRLTKRNLAADEVVRLHTALRRHGDNCLLYVRYEDPAHPNGTVEAAAPGLMIGYIDRFMETPDGILTEAPATTSWLAICQAAYKMWSARRDGRDGGSI